jgi:hypothetical protein
MRVNAKRRDQRTYRRQLTPLGASTADGDTGSARIRLNLPNLEIPAAPAGGALRRSRAVPGFVIRHSITSFLVTRTSTFDMHKPPPAQSKAPG